MATTTATILVGHAHQNHSGINPTHLIKLTENSRPALILQSLEKSNSEIVIIPTLENMFEDILLMIAVYILKAVVPHKDIFNKDRKSMYDLFNNLERFQLYEKSKIAIEKENVKFVVNILDGSHLLTLLKEVNKLPNDFEITTPYVKKEFNGWSRKVETRNFT